MTARETLKLPGPAQPERASRTLGRIGVAHRVRNKGGQTSLERREPVRRPERDRLAGGDAALHVAPGTELASRTSGGHRAPSPRSLPPV